ncbi:hypothetical protein ACIRRA_43130 [Nocardia sp. NPDC101769]
MHLAAEFDGIVIAVFGLGSRILGGISGDTQMLRLDDAISL